MPVPHRSTSPRRVVYFHTGRRASKAIPPTPTEMRCRRGALHIQTCRACTGVAVLAPAERLVQLTDVMERSLRAAWRLSTDARVWSASTALRDRSQPPVVRTETSTFFALISSRRRPPHYGFYARSREQQPLGREGLLQGSNKGAAGAPRLPGQHNFWQIGARPGRKSGEQAHEMLVGYN